MAVTPGPAGAGELPVITFDHSLTVHVNGEETRALHFASGHTDGDRIIFFARSNGGSRAALLPGFSPLRHHRLMSRTLLSVSDRIVR